MGNPVADTFYVNQARQTLKQLETFDFSLICEARIQTCRPPLTSIENVQTGMCFVKSKLEYNTPDLICMIIVFALVWRILVMLVLS